MVVEWSGVVVVAHHIVEAGQEVRGEGGVGEQGGLREESASNLQESKIQNII